MRGAKAAILVVASEPALGSRLCAALGRAGMACTLAATGAEAIHRLGEDAPAAILVDYAFADLDAELIVHRALACRETHGSPVVVLADDDQTDRDRLLALGCTEVFGRAADPHAVAQTLAAALAGGSGTPR